MKLLVLGGSVFLSRAAAEAGVAAGHEVTTFSRGRSGSQVAGARHVQGDRTVPDDLEQLKGEQFDVVFDTGYFPAHVKATAELLEPTTEHYVFVSSVNAFPGWPTSGTYHEQGEYDGDPDWPDDSLPEGVGEENAYGWRKVGCERAVRRAFGDDRTGIFRAGLIVGPHDQVGRLPWWLARTARGGDMLVPGRPDDVIRMIDCRDIAGFALLRPSGVFEVTGPANQTTRREFHRTLAEVTGAEPDETWVPDEFLTTKKVEGWTELPLWIPTSEAPSVFAHDTSAAEAAGLRCRAVAETATDVWRWMQTLEGGWQPSARTPGLAPEKERELLALWRS